MTLQYLLGRDAARQTFGGGSSLQKAATAMPVAGIRGAAHPAPHAAPHPAPAPYAQSAPAPHQSAHAESLMREMHGEGPALAAQYTSQPGTPTTSPGMMDRLRGLFGPTPGLRRYGGGF